MYAGEWTKGLLFLVGAIGLGLASGLVGEMALLAALVLYVVQLIDAPGAASRANRPTTRR